MRTFNGKVLCCYCLKEIVPGTQWVEPSPLFPLHSECDKKMKLAEVMANSKVTADLSDHLAKQVDIFDLVRDERWRQDKKFPGQWADPEFNDTWKLAVLMEEVGEVAKALLEHDPVEHLREELVQCAAVCFAWLEQL